MRALLVLLVFLGVPASLGAAGAEYRVLKEIAIGGDGGWDYLTLDPATHRLFVSHGDRVVVANVDTGTIVGTIPNTPGVHGIALAPDIGRAFTSNGRANTSTIVDLTTLQSLATVATGANPDSIRYLQDRKEVWTFNHTAGSITVFDPMSGRVMATIDVGGELEEAVEDVAAGRVYVNVENRSLIAVVDTVRHAVVATWPLSQCEGPTGLALDARNHLLLSACDRKMAVTDSRTGKPVTAFPIDTRVDGNGFDPSTNLAFASSGTGVLTIAHEDAPTQFSVVQVMKTQPTGRTMWLDAETHRVFVPVATTRAAEGGRTQIVPGTMRVLVIGTEP